MRIRSIALLLAAAATIPALATPANAAPAQEVLSRADSDGDAIQLAMLQRDSRRGERRSSRSSGRASRSESRDSRSDDRSDRRSRSSRAESRSRSSDNGRASTTQQRQNVRQRQTPVARQRTAVQADRRDASRDRARIADQRSQQTRSPYRPLPAAQADRRNDSRYDRNQRYDRDQRYNRDRAQYNRGYRDQRRTSQNYGNRQRYDRSYRDFNRSWRNDRRYNWQDYRRYNRNVYRLGSYYSPYRGRSYSRLSIGFTLGSGYFGSRYYINDPYRYRLPATRGSLRWIRYYDDALLVDTRDGYVVDVIYDIFW